MSNSEIPLTEASLSFTISLSLPKFMSIELVILSNLNWTFLMKFSDKSREDWWREGNGGRDGAKGWRGKSKVGQMLMRVYGAVLSRYWFLCVCVCVKESRKGKRIFLFLRIDPGDRSNYDVTVCVVCVCVFAYVCVSDSRHSADRSVFNPPLHRPRHSQVATSTICQMPKGRGGENEKEREEKQEGGRREGGQINMEKRGDECDRER